MWFIDYIIGMDKIIKDLGDAIDTVYDSMSEARTDSEKYNWSKVANQLLAISTALYAKRAELRKMVRV